MDIINTIVDAGAGSKKMTQTIYAFDTETFYCKKTYSVSQLGNYGYTHDPRFECYLVTIAGSDGFEFKGHPSLVPWDLLRGQVAVMHNAGFDLAVIDGMKVLGLCPQDFEFGEVYDTADLVAYLGLPRSLAQGTKLLYNVDLDKSVRDKEMNGKRWADMLPDLQERVLEYAMADPKWTLKIWMDHNHKWPEWERRISKITREACARGLPVDLELLNKGIETLEIKLWEARVQIPWQKDCPDDGEGILSKKALAIVCREKKITPPKSMAKDSEEFDQWLETHKETMPFVRGMSDYRRINSFLEKLKTMKSRVMPNGWMEYGSKYFGAHTGRDSAEGGVNMLNMPKEELFGVDIRKIIKAPPGFKLVACDESQIEPRVLAWLAGDTRLLEAIRVHPDFYEAQARAMDLWTKPEPLKSDPAFRHVIKGLNLGLGFGLGEVGYQLKSKVDAQTAASHVSMYRSKNPKITKLWDRLRIGATLRNGKDFEVELPSGRSMRYRDISSYGGLSAIIPRQGKMMRVKIWHGFLTENITQATARDIFSMHILSLVDHGYQVLLRVYDEALCLVKEETAEEDAKKIEEIMSTAPEWIKSIPLAAEAHVMVAYEKR